MYDAPLPLPEFPRPRPIRFVLCVVANIVLVGLGLTALLLLLRTLSTLPGVVLAVVLVAGLTSAVQRLLWWDGHPSPGRWVAVGVLAWSVGLIAALVFSFIGGPAGFFFNVGLAAPAAHVQIVPAWWYLVSAAVGGAIAGACQRLLLRRYAPGRLWWVPLSAISWGLGFYLIPTLVLGVDF